MEYNAKVTKLNLETTYQDELINNHEVRNYFYHEDFDHVFPTGSRKPVMRSPCKVLKSRKEGIGSFISYDWVGGNSMDRHQGYMVTFTKKGLHQSFKVVQVEGEHGLPSLTLLKHFLSRRFIKNIHGVVQQQFRVSFDRYGKEIVFYVFKLNESHS